MSSPPSLFGVIILGAGASTRMGKPKLLLPWGGRTVLSHLVNTWAELGATQIAVVTSSELEEKFRGEAPTAELIINPRPELGMFSSIRTAAEWPGWKQKLTAFVIALGDQPHLGKETLQPLLDLAGRNSDCICQPAFQGRPRHPVILPRLDFEELAATAAQTLKEFLEERKPRVKTIEVEDHALALDIDTPSDYAETRKIWESRETGS